VGATKLLAAWAVGFGTTFVAEDTYRQPQCVVKQLKPQATSPLTLQAARRLFDTEAQVLYQLESRSDSTTFSLLRGKSRILFSAGIHYCDLSQD